MKGQIVVTLITGHKIHSAIVEDDDWEKMLSDESKEDFKEIINSQSGHLDLMLPDGDWVIMPLRSILYLKFVSEDKPF